MKPEETRSTPTGIHAHRSSEKNGGGGDAAQDAGGGRAFVPELLTGVAATDESLRETCVGALEGSRASR